MAHLHVVRDSDSHYLIDPITRAITNANSAKNKLMQGDHNSEIYTFEIPRIVEGHDMSLCNKVEVHYNDISADKADSSKDVYHVDDFQIYHEDEEALVFSWLVSGNATKFAGLLSFRIRFACVDEEGNYAYKWHSDIFKGITISDGFDNADAVVEEYSDVLTKWEAELFGTGDTVQQQIIEVGEAVKASIPADYTEFTELVAATAIEQATEGEVIAVNDASDCGLQGLTIYGKTTQNGTPTPEAPVKLVSVGNSGVINTYASGKNLYDTTNGFVSSDYQSVCIKAGETFTASAYSTSGDRALNYRIGYADNTAAYFSIIPRDAVNNTWYTQTVTALKDVATVGFYHLTDGTANRSGLKLMVERGTVRTEYEDCKGTQTLTASTPNGLPGIPVSSGGIYTDENGQQWICDEIDFARGVYVQRIKKYQILNPSASGAVNYNAAFSVQQINFTGTTLGSKYYDCLSPQFAFNNNVTSGAYAGCKIAGNVIVMGVDKKLLHRYGAVEGDSTSYHPAFVAWANELVANGTPLEFLYIVPEPIETALSAEELAVYAALHTNKPNTIIYNDSCAHMAIEYNADTKTYIDNKFTELQNAILSAGANI